MKCYPKEATSNIALGTTLIKKGQKVYISEGFREGSFAKDYVKVFKKDGTYIGQFIKDNIDYYDNFK